MPFGGWRKIKFSLKVTFKFTIKAYFTLSTQTLFEAYKDLLIIWIKNIFCLRKWNFFGVKEFFFVYNDFKNWCKIKFQDNNEKSCSWFKNNVTQKIDFRADGTHKSHPTTWELIYHPKFYIFSCLIVTWVDIFWRKIIARAAVFQIARSAQLCSGSTAGAYQNFGHTCEKLTIKISSLDAVFIYGIKS